MKLKQKSVGFTGVDKMTHLYNPIQCHRSIRLLHNVNNPMFSHMVTICTRPDAQNHCWNWLVIQPVIGSLPWGNFNFIVLQSHNSRSCPLCCGTERRCRHDGERSEGAGQDKQETSRFIQPLYPSSITLCQSNTFVQGQMLRHDNMDCNETWHKHSWSPEDETKSFCWYPEFI